MTEIGIGICQLRSDVGEEDYDPRPANLERAIAAIDTVADDGAQLIVFGETYLNGYVSRELTWKYAVAESEDDPFVAELCEHAKRRAVTLVVGATTHKGAFPGDVYNSTLVIGPNGLIGVYSKSHIAALVLDGGRVADEKIYWSPGEELPVFDTPVGRIGIEICYDVWFPEVARTLALKGAELIINVSASLEGYDEEWGHLLFTRALENVVPYLHVTVVGRQRDRDIGTRSRLFGPLGTVLAAAPFLEETVITTRLDKCLLFEARAALHPFANRNPALYAEIARPR